MVVIDLDRTIGQLDEDLKGHMIIELGASEILRLFRLCIRLIHEVY